jgi:hypothetical protein
MDDKRKKKGGLPKQKGPTAYKAPAGNVKGIGPLGQFTGGAVPTDLPAMPGNPTLKGWASRDKE